MPKDYFKPATARKLFPEKLKLTPEQQYNLEQHQAFAWALQVPKTERLQFTTSEDIVIVVRMCPFCKVTRELVVDRTKYRQWRGGRLIQEVFPDLDRTQRELLITGIDDGCWRAQFGPE